MTKLMFNEDTEKFNCKGQESKSNNISDYFSRNILCSFIVGLFSSMQIKTSMQMLIYYDMQQLKRSIVICISMK